MAYVGIATPETFSKSTPAYFQDEDGHYIYSFCGGEGGQALYQRVQESVDAARAAQKQMPSGFAGGHPLFKMCFRVAERGAPIGGRSRSGAFAAVGPARRPGHFRAARHHL